MKFVNIFNERFQKVYLLKTAVTQKLLEHSSPNLTNKAYTNVDPVLCHAVDQMSIVEWLWGNRIVSAGPFTCLRFKPWCPEFLYWPKKGLIPNQYKPRIDTNPFHYRLSPQTSNCQLWPPVLLVMEPVDTTECRQRTPYRNRRPADCSYHRNQ